MDKLNYQKIIDGVQTDFIKKDCSEVEIGDKKEWIFPKSTWQTIKVESDKFKVDRDYYIYS